MAVGRDVPIAVKVVKQDKLFCQLVVIGSDVASEHHERRVAVTTREVAEYLVVSPVLLDDEHDVFDQGRIARAHRNRGCGAGRSGMVRSIPTTE